MAAGGNRGGHDEQRCLGDLVRDTRLNRVLLVPPVRVVRELHCIADLVGRTGGLFVGDRRPPATKPERGGEDDEKAERFHLPDLCAHRAAVPLAT
jgi:hypothetical protein